MSLNKMELYIQRDSLIQELRTTNDYQEQDRIKLLIDDLEEQLSHLQ